MVVLIAVAIVGRLLRKVFHFAGFGIPDHLLGVAVSAAKTLLVLGLLFSAFESLNKDHTLAEEKTLDRSVCYRPMIRLADSLFRCSNGPKSRYQSMNKNYGATIHRNGNPHDGQLVRRPHGRRGNGQVPYPGTPASERRTFDQPRSRGRPGSSANGTKRTPESSAK